MFGRRKQTTDAVSGVVGAHAPTMTTLTPVIAAHGGAGATTLCRWLGYHAQDWGMAVPPAFDGGSLIVVARSTAHGSARATELVRYLRTLPHCGRIVLAVVGDGLGTEPTAVRARLRALTPYVHTVVRIPYVARWRYEDDPLIRPAPEKYNQALQQLRSAVEAGSKADVTVPRRRPTWAPSPSS